ncbi:hypothetical protein GW17_00049019 [Ensete ventricosum]|nr:hypothetical protein GW17_00049019 [Ensete ventricosum]RZR93874.1 hypothetical protein BHM03_00022461 [Ensete ventricosum]
MIKTTRTHPIGTGLLCPILHIGGGGFLANLFAADAHLPSHDKDNEDASHRDRFAVSHPAHWRRRIPAKRC